MSTARPPGGRPPRGTLGADFLDSLPEVASKFQCHAAFVTRSFVPILLIFNASLALATTYRWVDANGMVHYGDVLPVQPSGLGHQELDQQGRVVHETRRTLLTPEERRRRAAEAEEREQQQRREAAQQRYDRALLSTYADASEISLARDRALELEQFTLKELQANLDSTVARLAYANHQLARYRAAHTTAPANLLQMRAEAQSEVTQASAALQQKGNAIDELKRRFEADRLRFEELIQLKERK